MPGGDEGRDLSSSPGPLRRFLQGLRAPADSGTQLPAGASAELDVAYGTHPAQRMDVYRPPAGGPHAPAPSALSPVLVLVHGGAWSLGDKAQPRFIVAKRSHWLAQGFVVVSVNYRLMPEAGPLQQAHDVAIALAFVQASMARWAARSDRLLVMGHSTGAHLVALLAADAQLLADAGARPWAATVLLDSATLDVERTMRGPHMPFHDRAFGTDPGRWADASPLHRLQAAARRGDQPPAPMLLVHGIGRPESAEQAAWLAHAARAAGGRAEVLGVALDHADINRQLGLPGVYTDRVDAFIASLGWAT